MTAGHIAAGLAAGGIVAAGASLIALRNPPAELVRTNVNGISVPAVLGLPVVVAGSLVALGLGVAGGSFRVALAIAVVVVGMGAAGYLDDRRGAEAARGFGGHLRAAIGGELTGGVVKLVAGGVVGLAAGLLVGELPGALLTALLVAGTANLLNLLDTAPGRAGKVAVASSAALIAWGNPLWAVGACGTVGGALAVLPLDLRERGMLGDAGANPLGAVVGLGLAVSLPPWAQGGALVLVAGLNLASERWSFARLIERAPVLRALDRWGRSGVK